MKRFSIISLAALSLVIALVAVHADKAKAADATPTGCPQGYTCVPVPVVTNCPAGDICMKVDGVPSLSLLTQAGGDNLTAGDSIRTLAWVSHNLPTWATLSNFRVLLIGATSTITLGLPADSRFQNGFNGYLNQNGISFLNDIKIPSTVTPGPYIVAVSCPSCGRGAESLSLSSVMIHATSTSPTVSVMQPSAHTVLTAGDPVLLRWSSKNIPVNQRVMIGMYSVSDPSKAYMVSDTGVLNTGIYLWHVPSDAEGTYNMQVSCKDCVVDNGTLTYGWGGTFTVKQAPVRHMAVGSSLDIAAAATPTPTPTPTPDASDSPTPTPTPEPSATPSPTE